MVELMTRVTVTGYIKLCAASETVTKFDSLFRLSVFDWSQIKAAHVNN